MAADANQHMIEDRGTMMVVLWDVGPRKPVQPKRPDTPQGKDKDPSYEIAKAEFADTLEVYQAELKAFREAKKEYEAWNKQWGGPYEMFNYWSCDAQDALKNDPERYFISASTRGHGALPNRGLPEGLKPGRGHFDNLERIRAGDSDMAKIRQSDPVFGKQELRT
jgi:hypothetical protein